MPRTCRSRLSRTGSPCPGGSMVARTRANRVSPSAISSQTGHGHLRSRCMSNPLRAPRPSVPTVAPLITTSWPSRSTILITSTKGLPCSTASVTSIPCVRAFSAKPDRRARWKAITSSSMPEPRWPVRAAFRRPESPGAPSITSTSVSAARLVWARPTARRERDLRQAVVGQNRQNGFHLPHCTTFHRGR